MKKPKNAIPRPSRCENLKRLIAALRQGDRNRFQVAEILEVSPENAGKYLGELKRESVIAIARTDAFRHGSRYRTSYVLIANEQTIQAYVAGLDAPVTPSVRQARLAAERVRREAKAMPPPVQVAKFDPLALPRNFFKPSAEDLAQPADRIERAPAKPTGFAALANVRFQLASEVCA